MSDMELTHGTECPASREMNSCAILAKWIAGLDLSNLDRDYEYSVRLRILDLVVSSVAGIKVNNAYNRMVERVVCGFGGKEQSSVFFRRDKLPAPAAAFINASYGHGADLDDGHKTANGHPGVAVIPAVLALAESEGSSSKAIWESILVGYEVYIRVSNVIQPGALHRGFHGTGIVGAVAASAACAKLLNLNEEQTFHAISYGTIQASGLFEVSESGQMCKPINPANACRTGILSALMAREGVKAPQNPFEGLKGFYKAFTDELRIEELCRDLDYSNLQIDTAYIKLYPACRHLHPPVDAGSELRRRTGFQLDKIRKIRIHIYPNSILVTGKIRKPASADEAKFSMTYALACALQRGTYTLEDLENAGCMDAVTESLIDRMDIIPDPSCENKEKHIRGCTVELEMEGGEILRAYVPVPKGDPENPLNEEDILGKVKACCQGIYDEAAQKEIYASIMQTQHFDLRRMFCVLHQYTNM